MAKNNDSNPRRNRTMPNQTMPNQPVRSQTGRSRGEKGAVVIMLALLIVPLAVVTATVVDLGFVRTQRASLQNAADAAAVAAGNELSGAGSGAVSDDGMPQAACIRALASLRQNIDDFASVDVDDTGGCAGNLPALVSACVAAGGAGPVTLTATSGDVTAELTYPVPGSIDEAQNRVTYVRSGASIHDADSPDARCRAMLVSVKRIKIGPFFAGILNGTGQSVAVDSLGAHLDSGFTDVTTPSTTTPATTTTTLPPPNAGGNFLLQHTLAGSSCAGNVNAPYFVGDLDSPSATKINMKGCTNIFKWVQAQVWTAYGIGSNGLGTVVVVGDQDRFSRFTGCSAAQGLGAGAIVQTDAAWVGGGGNLFYDVVGVGTHWVAVGSGGQVRLSDNDGRSWRNAASKPPTGSPLTEVATDGSGTWIAASNSGVIGQLYRSTDNGEHWTTVTDSSFGASVVRTVTWDQAAGMWLASGTLGKIWKSTTGAKDAWDTVAVTLKDSGPAGDDLISITASPTGTILVAAGGFGRVYRATTPDGPYTSSGSQITWAAVPMRVRFGPPNGTDKQVMLVGMANQNWFSKDDGVTWAKVTSGMPSSRTWTDVASCAVGGT